MMSSDRLYLHVVLTVDYASQEKGCASLYEMKTYVEPNEIEPTLVCIHDYTMILCSLL